MALIDELAKKGVLEKDKLDSLKEEIKTSGKKEEEIILARRVVSEDFLFNLKSEYLKVPLKEAVDPNEISLEVLEMIPQETAKNYNMVSLAKKNKILEVGMIYPENLDAQEALKFLSRRGKFNYRVFLITPSTLNKILRQYRTLRKEVGRAIEELEEELKIGVVAKPGEIERLVEEAPISKVVAVILRYAVEGKASDIHIEPAKDKLRIRFRVLGTLHSSIFLPIRLHLAIVSRVKVLSNLKIDETRIPQDGRFSTKVETREIDFRVSTFPTTLGEKVVIRVLDPNIGLKKFEELGLSKYGSDIIKRQMKKSYGLILSTGPTGSGKTTTLYAILQLLNEEGSNIVTLEDPVEYFVAGVNQSQVKPEIDYTFARGLRHIIRQDPDIIMVGEIRDSETANLVTHAALTGHIVLSTLHTSNSFGVIPRLIDLGVESFLIPPTLRLAIAQRLIRRLCDDCKKKVKAKEKIKDLILKEIQGFPERIKKEVKIPQTLFIFESVGCSKCNNSGFSGRIGVFEVLEMTDQLAEIILEGFSEKNIEEEAKRQAMVTMKQDGILKVLEGITTVEEIISLS
ncbi:MAG: GspE/PulE family protein [Patescibacteria group bacterium]|nr:GspE/PulE family protein [Patescibacteria group bacterium]